MYRDENGGLYFKVATHLHTTRSDGQLTPDGVIGKYAADGYDAVALTDHWVYQNGGERDGVLVLSGCEYNLGNGVEEPTMHIVGIGMQNDPHLTQDMSRQQIIDGITGAGGLAILAHPAWSLNTVEELAALRGFTATEIYNTVSEAHNSLRADSSLFVDLAAYRGYYLKLLAADDAHYYDGTDDRKGWIMIKAANGSEKALLDAIRRGDFYATQGPHLSVQREGDLLKIDTSPASYIGTLSNLPYLNDRVLRGEGLTHFTYRIRPNERYVRVEISDAAGRRAWSNVFINE